MEIEPHNFFVYARKYQVKKSHMDIRESQNTLIREVKVDKYLLEFKTLSEQDYAKAEEGDVYSENRISESFIVRG